jgi:hypothetical protein
MKTKLTRLISALALLALSTFNSQLSTCIAQGTAFTYQGRLNSSGAVANGSYDLQFTLYTTNVTGTALAGPVTNTAVVVTNGLFTTLVDFGPGVFSGTSNWLEIAVSTNSANSFSTLEPRQQLTPVPYAITAANVSGQISPAQLPAGLVTNNEAGLNLNGTFSGNGAAVTNVNAAALNGLNATNFWQLGGNTVAAGQFLGSLNNQPVDFYANTNRALRLQYATDGVNVTPNVIGGSAGNNIGNGGYGDFIGGGGNAAYPNQIGQSAYYSSILGGENNTVNGSFSLAGGGNNTVSGGQAVGLGYNNSVTGTGDIALGIGNEAGNYGQAQYATAIGTANHADGGYAVAMGNYNTAGGLTAVAMGQHNTASGNYATALGYNTIASGPDSAALGTYANAANDGTFVWADDTAGYFTSTANNQFLIRATGGVGINTNNPAGNALHVSGNVLVDNAAVIVGGWGNSIAGGVNYSVISGGANNQIQPYAFVSTIAGGSNNVIQFDAYNATIGGGVNNLIATNSVNATIAGGVDNQIQDNAPLTTIGGGDVNVIQSGAYKSTISGGYQNIVQSNAVASMIGGGNNNIISGKGSFIGGGGYDGSYYQGNINNGNASVIVGGLGNSIASGGDYSVISGGGGNMIQTNAFDSVIGGGSGNMIQTNAFNSVIGGGGVNMIQTNAFDSVISGGSYNYISGIGSVIGGGGYDANTYDPTQIGGNSITANDSVIGGGANNTIADGAYESVIGGGNGNTIEEGAHDSVIGGGNGNTISDWTIAATIAGGQNNHIDVGGDYSFVAGQGAYTSHKGSFVWADSQNVPAVDWGDNTVSFRCAGGVFFSSGNGGANQMVAWTPGSASWSYSSDRNLKDRFASVNQQSVLDKLAQLPIVEWSYKGYSQRHIGPMAQDFHALFPLNENDKALQDADLHGVELAAIKGLNEKVESGAQKTETQMQQLAAENADLKARLEKLEQLMTEKLGGAK